jgi:hypothetical protein
MEGLSIDDARSYLKKYDINGDLQNSILNVCKETFTSQFEKREIGYFPYKLGLCVDIVTANRTNKGSDPDPASFNLPPGKTDMLIERFIRSLSDISRLLVKKIATTPRFDKPALKFAYSPTEISIAQKAACETLLGYSFVQEPKYGWFSIHGVLRDALKTIIEQDGDNLTKMHQELI